MAEFIKCNGTYRSLLSEDPICRFYLYPSVYVQFDTEDRLPDIVKFKLAAINIENATGKNLFDVVPNQSMHGWRLMASMLGQKPRYCIKTTPEQMMTLRRVYAADVIETTLTDQDLTNHEMYNQQMDNYKMQNSSYQQYAQQMNQTQQQIQSMQNQYAQQMQQLGQYGQSIAAPPSPPPGWQGYGIAAQPMTTGTGYAGLGGVLGGFGNQTATTFTTTNTVPWVKV